MSLIDSPSQRDLRTGLIIFLANLDEYRILNEFANVGTLVVNGVSVAKGGVMRDVDIVIAVPLCEGVLLQVLSLSSAFLLSTRRFLQLRQDIQDATPSDALPAWSRHRSATSPSPPSKNY